MSLLSVLEKEMFNILRVLTNNLKQHKLNTNINKAKLIISKG